jgi:hypothetical protein
VKCESARRGAERLTETLVLLLEGHDPRREQAAEAEPVALRQREGRVLRSSTRGELRSHSASWGPRGRAAAYLVVPRVVEDVVAALVHDAGARHGGAPRRGGGRRQEPPELRRPPRHR